MIDDNFSTIDNIYKLQAENRMNIAQFSIDKRIKLLENLETEIINKKEFITNAINLDFRKNHLESESTEIFPVIAEIRLFKKYLKIWAKEKSVSNNRLFFGSNAKIIYEPKGMCLIISPWNYPFQLALIHLVACVAAGNSAILKPSEFTLHTNKIIEQILENVFDDSHVKLINGAVEETNYLLQKKFDHIHFTGSPKVGKIIMGAAAKHLSSVTLELGGKSPMIIDETISIKQAVSKAIWGKMINNGQTCIAPDYIIIHESKKQQFIEEFVLQIEEKFGKNPQKSEDLARIINRKNFDRLKALIDNALNLGAKCPYGNQYDENDLYIKPTLLTDINCEMNIYYEEIFGPIFPILTYQTQNQIIEIIQQHEKPLALYIFSNNKNFINHITDKTSSGAILINDVLVHILHPNLPFGGVNNSGIGYSTGFFGFSEFSHQKPFLKVNALLSPSKLLDYPYNKVKKRLINFMIRYF